MPNPETHNPDGSFKKGNKLGPGRPPGVSFKEVTKKIGNQLVDFKGEKITKIEAVIIKTFAEAMAGRSWAVQFLADRLDGKAVQRQEIEAFIESRRDDPETAIRQARAMLAEMEPEAGLIEGPK